MVSDALAPGDCTVAQLGLDPNDSSFVDVYRITLPADGFITVDLQSPEFDTVLLVFDDVLSTLIYFNDDYAPSSDSFIPRVPLPAGSYIILVNSFEIGETGTYDLVASQDATSNPACDVVVDLPTDVVVDGTFSVGDCTVAQIGFDGTDQTFIDQYRVSLPSGGTLTISLDSIDVDPFVAVLEEDLTVVATDDDSGGNFNALISDLLLAPGDYLIAANHFSDGVTGDYTLTLVPEPSGVLLHTAALLTTVGTLARRRRARRRRAAEPGVDAASATP
jgi:hypothetical protein